MSASIGVIEPARRAGSTEAANVTPSPTASAIAIEPLPSCGASNGIEPTVRT